MLNATQIGLGVYSIAEAARLIGMTADHVGRWIRRDAAANDDAVLKTITPVIDGVPQLNLPRHDGTAGVPAVLG